MNSCILSIIMINIVTMVYMYCVNYISSLCLYIYVYIYVCVHKYVSMYNDVG